VQAECVGKHLNFSMASAKTSVTSKPLLVSFIVARRKRPHSVGECLVLLTAVDIIGTMLEESYAKELRKIPFEGDTLGRTVSVF
jgi:hypothetical protein